MDNNTKKALLTELRDLLTKYNVSIGFTCGESSDTYGLYDDQLIIVDDSDNTRIAELGGWWCTIGSISELLT